VIKQHKGTRTHIAKHTYAEAWGRPIPDVGDQNKSFKDKGKQKYSIYHTRFCTWNKRYRRFIEYRYWPT